jgi:hypothetical protein
MLAAAALFVFALACLVYVAFKFLSLGISLDAMLSRQLYMQQLQQASQQQVKQPGQQFSQQFQNELHDFMNRPQTEGEFIPASDTESFVREEAEKLRKKGMSEEEMQQFIQQAVGAELD